jgi:hypothetical protein
MQSEKDGLIYQKIPAIMTDISAISKSRNNTVQNFKFRGIDDIYNELHPLLAKHEVFTVPEILSREYKERTTKNGSLMTERVLTIRYTFYAVDGSFIQATVDGEAMDTGDKATNKCMSIAHKYALLQIFCIPTEDSGDDKKDPDFISHEKIQPRKSSFKIGPEETQRIKELCEDKKMTGTELAEHVLKEYGCKFNYLSEIEYIHLRDYLMKKESNKI